MHAVNACTCMRPAHGTSSSGMIHGTSDGTCEGPDQCCVEACTVSVSKTNAWLQFC
jgi:hypothetical protein